MLNLTPENALKFKTEAQKDYYGHCRARLCVAQKCKNIDKYSDFREDLKLNFTDNFIKKYLNLEVIDDARKFCEWFDANVEFLSWDEITEKIIETLHLKNKNI